MTKKMTPAQIEAQAEKLSAWAESDDFFNAMDDAHITEHSEEDDPHTQVLMAALKRGRPEANTRSQGASPAIQFRVPEDLRDLLLQRSKQEQKTQSQLAREALVSYLNAS